MKFIQLFAAAAVAALSTVRAQRSSTPATA
jgi:hypothetical protein